MKKLRLAVALTAALCLLAPVVRADDTVVSTGKAVALAQNLAFEQATLFVFYKPSSSMERDFVDALKKACEGKSVALDRETAFLFAYRAIAYERFSKEAQRRGIPIQREMEFNHRGPGRA